MDMDNNVVIVGWGIGGLNGNLKNRIQIKFLKFLARKKRFKIF